MTKRSKSTILLMAAVPLSWEVWKFWEGSEKIINPWISLNYPLNIQWVIKFAGIQFGYLLMSLVIYRLSRMNEVIRLAASVLVALALFDLGAFFYNFNRNDYSLVYLGISAGTLLYSFYKDQISLWITRKRYASRRKFIRWKLKLDQWLRNRKQKSVPVETKLIKKEKQLV